MGEALVVAQVKVGLGAIVGHENLAVLERAHGARIHVEVGIEFLQADPQTAALQQAADGGGADPLTKGRNHATGHENVFSHYGLTLP